MTAVGSVLALVAGLGLAGPIGRSVAAARVRQRLGGAGGEPAARYVPVPGPLRRRLDAAGLGDGAERLVLVWAGALAAAAIASISVPSARLLLVVVAIGPPAGLQLSQGRVARRRIQQLPEALDAVAAGLRGGVALPMAIAGATEVGPPLGEELRAIVREVDGGRPLTEALERWRAEATDTHTALAGAALAVAARVGGPGARAVDGAAASLRDRLASDAETTALATQGRASAAVLTLAPLAFSFLLATIDPGAARFLLGTPLGWACIAVGTGLDALGAWWMGHLVRRAR